jgi:quercetin dioxygenase-like cupin family protein
MRGNAGASRSSQVCANVDISDEDLVSLSHGEWAMTLEKLKLAVAMCVLSLLPVGLLQTKAIPYAQPGDVIDVRPLADELAASITKTLIKTPHVEVIRMVLPAGKVMSEHKAHGEIIVQCLEGYITFTTMGEPKKLRGGDMLYLAAGEPHELEAVEDSSFLLTILLQSGGGMT